MNRTLTIIASSAIAVAIAIGPASAFAKNDKADALHGRAQAQASTTMKAKIGCARAFGHLMAPGWIAKNSTTTISSACKIPFGIGLKLGLFQRPAAGTTTPDTIAPAISDLAQSAGTTTVTVTWLTNERADSQLAYGTTTAYGATTTLDTNRVYAHSVTIPGLAAGTTYHYKVMSRDASGNLSASGDRTVTTGSPDTASPAISAIAVSGVSSTTAMISWTTNEPASSKVYFAAGPSLDLITASTVSSTALLTTHAMTVSGLSASTTYSYAVRSEDAFSNTATSATSSFTTTL